MDPKTNDEMSNEALVTPEIEIPLSPVLTNSKQNRKRIYRKSRVKLINKFSQNTETSPVRSERSNSPFSEVLLNEIKQQNTQKTDIFSDSKFSSCSKVTNLSCLKNIHTDIESPVVQNYAQKNLNFEQNCHRSGQNDSNFKALEAKINKINELKNMKRFHYDIKSEECKNNSGTQNISLSCKFSDTCHQSSSKSVMLENKTNNESIELSKKVSPVWNKKNSNLMLNEKNSNLSQNEPLQFFQNSNISSGFSTAKGKVIEIPERKLKRACKIFFDIFENEPDFELSKIEIPQKTDKKMVSQNDSKSVTSKNSFEKKMSPILESSQTNEINLSNFKNDFFENSKLSQEMVISQESTKFSPNTQDWLKSPRKEVSNYINKRSRINNLTSKTQNNTYKIPETVWSPEKLYTQISDTQVSKIIDEASDYQNNLQRSKCILSPEQNYTQISGTQVSKIIDEASEYQNNTDSRYNMIQKYFDTSKKIETQTSYSEHSKITDQTIKIDKCQTQNQVNEISQNVFKTPKNLNNVVKKYIDQNKLEPSKNIVNPILDVTSITEFCSAIEEADFDSPFEESPRNEKKNFQNSIMDTQNDFLGFTNNTQYEQKSTLYKKIIKQASENFLIPISKIYEDNLKEEILLSSFVESVKEKNISNYDGFQTASGKKLTVNKDKLKEAEKMFLDLQFEDLTPNAEKTKLEILNNNEFKTASCLKVNIDNEEYKKTQTDFVDMPLEDISSNFETPRNVSFKSTSGSKLKINKEKLKKSENIFSDISREDISSNFDTSKMVTQKNVSFKTASGSDLKINEEKLKKAQSIFSDISLEDISSNFETPKNVSFKSASGSKLKINKEKLKKAENIFPDISREDISSNFDTSKMVTPKNVSFKTASGSDLKINEEKLKKAQGIFSDISLEDISSNFEISKVGTPKNVSFKSASDSELNVNDRKLKKIQSAFLDIPHEDSSSNFESPNIEIPKSVGFKTAGGVKLKMDKEKIKKAQSIFADIPLDDVFSNIEPLENKTAKDSKLMIENAKINQISSNLKTFETSNLKLKEENIKKAQSISSDIPLKDIPSNFESPKLETPRSAGFKTAAGSKLRMDEETMKKARNIFSDIPLDDLISIDIPKITPLKENNSFSNNTTPKYQNLNQSISKKRRLGVSACRQYEVSENNLKRAKLIFEDLDSTDLNLSTPKRRFDTSSANFDTPKINNFETPKNTHKNNLITPKNIKNSHLETSTNYPPDKHYLYAYKSKQDTCLNCLKNENCIFTKGDSHIFLKKENMKDVKQLKKEYEKEISKLQLQMAVMKTRMDILKEQEEIINNGDENHRKKHMGHLFTLKINKNDRISIQKYVDFKRPHQNIKNYIASNQISLNIIDITPRNALDIKFYVPWSKNPNRTYPSIIQTEENGKIVPNLEDEIGCNEFEISFKSTEGIDPRLIPRNWIRNHFKWIVWKLASMERAFPGYFQDYLSINNIFVQLKYRYNIEIDSCRRSALKKILELDDTPSKLMVLCVSDIIDDENIELTDGWYAVRAVMDKPLCSLVDKNILKVGTKIFIHGAELINGKGCSPLEVPEDVHLKIYYNSTRRAHWSSKLGFQSIQRPFQIPLSTIHPLGGSISCIKVYIARIYPQSFMETSASNIIWRNEKAENKRIIQYENERMKYLERAREEVELELEKERDKNRKREKVGKRVLESVGNPKDLYEILENSFDPEAVKEMMTESQWRAAQSYSCQVASHRQADLSARLKKKLEGEPKRKVSPVLRLQLVDTKCIYQHKIINLWFPREEHFAQLKEGIVVNFYNTIPRNTALTSLLRTKFEIDKEFNLDQFDSLRRSVTPILELYSDNIKLVFNEFDTAGVVIHIDVQQKVQHIWLADQNQRLLSIKIREGPETCCLLDNLKSGQVVAVMNLILLNQSKDLVEVVANRNSLFTTNPKKIHLKNYVYVFQKELPKAFENYLEECKSSVELKLAQRNVLFNDLNPKSFENDLTSSVQKKRRLESEELASSDDELFFFDTSKL